MYTRRENGAFMSQFPAAVAFEERPKAGSKCALTAAQSQVCCCPRVRQRSFLSLLTGVASFRTGFRAESSEKWGSYWPFNDFAI